MSANASNGMSFMAQYGLDLLKNEYVPLPVAPETKVPHRWGAGNGWTELPRWSTEYTLDTVTPGMVRTWSSWPQCGVSILAEGLSQLDIDVYDPAAVNAITADLAASGVPMPDFYRVGQDPKRLYVRRASVPHKKIKITSGRARQDGREDAIEILGNGQQVVVYGIHPTGVLYRWFGGRDLTRVHRNDLPVSSASDLVVTIVVAARHLRRWQVVEQGAAAVDAYILSLIDDLPLKVGGADAEELRQVAYAMGVQPVTAVVAETRRDDVSVRREFGTASEAKVQSAVQCILEAVQSNPALLGDHGLWKLKFGGGLVAACRDLPDGYKVASELFALVSAAGEKSDPAMDAREFERLYTSPLTQVGAGSLFWLARQHGWGWVDDVSAADEADEAASVNPGDIVIDVTPEDTPPLRAEFGTARDVMLQPARYVHECFVIAGGGVPVSRAHEAWLQLEQLKLRKEGLEAGLVEPDKHDKTLDKRIEKCSVRLDNWLAKSGVAYDPRKPEDAAGWGRALRSIDHGMLCGGTMGSGKTHAMISVLKTGSALASFPEVEAKPIPNVEKLRTLVIVHNHERSRAIAKELGPEMLWSPSKPGRATVWFGPSQMWIDGVTPVHPQYAASPLAKVLGIPPKWLCSCRDGGNCGSIYCNQPSLAPVMIKAGGASLKMTPKERAYYDVVVMEDMNAVDCVMSEVYRFSLLERFSAQSAPRAELPFSLDTYADKLNAVEVEQVQQFVAAIKRVAETKPDGKILDHKEVEIALGEITALGVGGIASRLLSEARNLIHIDPKDAPASLAAVDPAFAPWIETLEAILELANCVMMKSHKHNLQVIKGDKPEETAIRVTYPVIDAETAKGAAPLMFLSLNGTEDDSLLGELLGRKIDVMPPTLIPDFDGVWREGLLGRGTEFPYRGWTPPDPKDYTNMQQLADDEAVFRSNMDLLVRHLRIQALLFGSAGATVPKSTKAYLDNIIGSASNNRFEIDSKITLLSTSTATGSNALKNCITLTTVTTQRVKPRDIEPVAQALSPQPIRQIMDFEQEGQSKTWYWRDDPRKPGAKLAYMRLRKGGAKAFAKLYHPDPWVEKVRHQKMEAQSAQYNDRARSITQNGRTQLVHLQLAKVEDDGKLYDDIITRGEFESRFPPEGGVMAQGLIPLDDPEAVFGAILGLKPQRMRKALAKGEHARSLWECVASMYRSGAHPFRQASEWSVTFDCPQDGNATPLRVSRRVVLPVAAGAQGDAFRFLERVGLKAEQLEAVDRGEMGVGGVTELVHPPIYVELYMGHRTNSVIFGWPELPSAAGTCLEPLMADRVIPDLDGYGVNGVIGRTAKKSESSVKRAIAPGTTLRLEVTAATDSGRRFNAEIVSDKAETKMRKPLKAMIAPDSVPYGLWAAGYDLKTGVLSDDALRSGKAASRAISGIPGADDPRTVRFIRGALPDLMATATERRLEAEAMLAISGAEYAERFGSPDVARNLPWMRPSMTAQHAL